MWLQQEATGSCKAANAGLWQLGAGASGLCAGWLDYWLTGVAAWDHACSGVPATEAKGRGENRVGPLEDMIGAKFL